MKTIFNFLCITTLCLLSNNLYAITAEEIITNAINNWRGERPAYSQVELKVIRPNRTDNMSMDSWAKDDDKSLVKFRSPNRVRGQGMLLKDDSIWTYSARSNRTVKISNSLRSNSWMGSDVSYDDMSKASDIINNYDHKIINSKQEGDKTIYTIESIPKPNAPVPWGKEVLTIDSNNVLLERDFYDQDGKKIKTMTTIEQKVFEDKMFPSHVVFKDLEKEGYETHFITIKLQYDDSITDNFFNITNLESK